MKTARRRARLTFCLNVYSLSLFLRAASLFISKGNFGVADISGMQGVGPGNSRFTEETEKDDGDPTVNKK